ncbi:MAG: hypothetical protein H7A23_10190 [Leptospiraceae bacterium]|nr:hypothetical protein [Leptospiraceae bacterium]
MKIIEKRRALNFPHENGCITEHTHCGSELDWKLFTSLHRERLGSSSKCSAFV